MKWLLSTEVLNRMRAARTLGYAPTLEERREFAAAMQEAHARKPGAGPRNLKVAGDVAQINVEGVLTEKPDCFALMFGDGNTTYASIREALANADADPNVKSIVLHVDSPGGSVHGLFETLDALAATEKPITSIASLAASAAYAIVAAAGGKVHAKSLGSQFGSIGVAASIYLDDDVLDLASTEAPNKRPDVSTEAGQAVVREELDAIHEVFVTNIAAGRAHATGDDFDADRINSDFGRGGVLLAKEAKKRGMIDSLPKAIERTPRGKHASAEDVGENPPQEKKHMDLATLKAQHPAVFAQAFEEGKAVGLTEGVATERKRVKAHVTMAQSAGILPKKEKGNVALGFIEAGVSVQDDEVFAAYQSAAMNRQAQNDRQTETEDAGTAASGAKKPDPAAGAPDDGDKVAAAMGLTPTPKKPA